MFSSPLPVRRLIPGLLIACGAIFGVLAAESPARAAETGPSSPAPAARTRPPSPTSVAPEPAPTLHDSTQIARDRQADIRLFDAETYLEEGNYAEAVPLLEQIVAANPDRIDIWEQLARSYQLWVASMPDAPDEIVGRAVTIYRAILERQPGNRFALEAVRELGGRYTGPIDLSLKDSKALKAWRAAEAEAERQSRLPPEQRDLSLAIAKYREALQREPRHPGMFVRLARSLTVFDPVSPEARNLYIQALQINPADLEALNGLAGIELAGERYESAEGFLELALELEEEAPPDSIPAEAPLTRQQLGQVLDRLGERDPTARRHYYLGRLHLAEKHYQEAAKAFRTALDIDSTEVAYPRYLGIALFNLDEYNESLGYFQKTLEMDPVDPDALFHIGSMLYDLDHYEEAIQHLRVVVDLPRYRARASRLLGLALTRVDQHSETATFYLEQAIREGAEDPQLYCVLGEQYLRLERWDDARARFDECLKSQPGHPAGLLGSGLVADHDRKYQKATELLEEFLKGHPDSPAVLMRLGLSYLKLDAPDTAAARFRQAIRSDSSLAAVKVVELTPDQVFELGFLILMAGRNYEDGIVIGEHLARRAPDNPGYANNLAMAYADADRNLDRALELSRMANRKSPDNAGFMDTMGWTFVKLRKYKDAQKTLARAIELAEGADKPDASEIYYHMGYLLAEMKKTDEAIQYLQKSLDNPGNPLVEDSARKLLAKLQEK